MDVIVHFFERQSWTGRIGDRTSEAPLLRHVAILARTEEDFRNAAVAMFFMAPERASG